MTRISFIVNTFNRPADVFEACIDSVRSQLTRECGVVVVDQNATPAVGIVSDVAVVHFPTKSISLARNKGVEVSPAEWYVFLDDDAVLKPGSLAGLFTALAAAPPAFGVIAGKIEIKDSDRLYSIRQKIKSGPLSFAMLNAVMGGALAIKDDCWRELGGFDERFGIGSDWASGEESDFVIRGYRRGWKIVYVREFAIAHPAPSEMDDAKVKAYALGKGAMIRKHVTDGWSTLLLIECADAFLLPLAECLVYAARLDGKVARRALLKLRYRIKGFRSFSHSTGCPAR
jgi:GT2 family glycosyltransferase